MAALPLPMVSTVTVPVVQAHAHSASSSTECLIQHRVGSRWATSFADPAGFSAEETVVKSVSVCMTWGKGGGVSVKRRTKTRRNGGYSSDEEDKDKRRWTLTTAPGEEGRARRRTFSFAGDTSSSSPSSSSKKSTSKRYSFRPSRNPPAPPPEAPSADSAEAAHANALAKLTGGSGPAPASAANTTSPEKKQRRFGLRSLPARPPTPEELPPNPSLPSDVAVSLEEVKAGMSFAVADKPKRGWGEYDAFGAVADMKRTRPENGEVALPNNPFASIFAPVSPEVGEGRRAKRLSRHAMGERAQPPAVLPLPADMLAGVDVDRVKREREEAQRKEQDTASKARPLSMPAARPPQKRTLRRKPPPRADDIFDTDKSKVNGERADQALASPSEAAPVTLIASQELTSGQASEETTAALPTTEDTPPAAQQVPSPTTTGASTPEVVTAPESPTDLTPTAATLMKEPTTRAPQTADDGVGEPSAPAFPAVTLAPTVVAAAAAVAAPAALASTYHADSSSAAPLSTFATPISCEATSHRAPAPARAAFPILPVVPISDLPPESSKFSTVSPSSSLPELRAQESSERSTPATERAEPSPSGQRLAHTPATPPNQAPSKPAFSAVAGSLSTTDSTTEPASTSGMPQRSLTPPTVRAFPTFGASRSAGRPSTAPSVYLIGSAVAAHAALASSFDDHDAASPPATVTMPLRDRRALSPPPRSIPTFGGRPAQAGRPSTAPSESAVRVTVARAPGLAPIHTLKASPQWTPGTLAPTVERQPTQTMDDLLAPSAPSDSGGTTPPATAESGLFPHHRDEYADAPSMPIEAGQGDGSQLAHPPNTGLAASTKFPFRATDIAAIPPYSPRKRAAAPMPAEYKYDRPAAHARAAESLRARHGLSPEPPSEAQHLRVSQYGELPELDFTRTPPPEQQEEIERERERERERGRGHRSRTPSEPDAVLQTPALSSEQPSVPSAISHQPGFLSRSNSDTGSRASHPRTPSAASAVSNVSAVPPSVSAFTDRLPSSRQNLAVDSGAVEGLLSAQHTGTTGFTSTSGGGSGMATVEGSPRAPSWIDHARPPRIFELEAAVVAAAAAAHKPLPSAQPSPPDIPQLDASTTRASLDRVAREPRRFGAVTKPNGEASASASASASAGANGNANLPRPTSSPTFNPPPPPPSKDHFGTFPAARNSYASPASSAGHSGSRTTSPSPGPATGQFTSAQWAKLQPIPPGYAPALSRMDEAPAATGTPNGPAYASATHGAHPNKPVPFATARPASRPTTPAGGTDSQRKRFSFRGTMPSSASLSALSGREGGPKKKRFSLLGRGDIFKPPEPMDEPKAKEKDMSAPSPADPGAPPSTSASPAGGVGSRLSGLAQTPLPPPPAVAALAIGSRSTLPASFSRSRRPGTAPSKPTVAEPEPNVSRSNSVTSRRSRRWSFKLSKEDKQDMGAEDVPPVPSVPPQLQPLPPLPTLVADGHGIGMQSTAEAVKSPQSTSTSHSNGRRSDRSDPNSVKRAVPLHKEIEAREAERMPKKKPKGKFMRTLRGLFKSNH